MVEIVGNTNKNSTTIMKTNQTDSVSIKNSNHDENKNNNISEKSNKTQIKKEKKRKKKKTNRCAFCHDGSKCKKKLSLVDLSIKCRCGKSFCSIHRNMSDHFCTSLEETCAEKKALLGENLGGGKFIQIDKI